MLPTLIVILTIIACGLGGVLATSGAIAKKRPDAKAYLDKLAPYQGIIGIALLVLGVIGILALFALNGGGLMFIFWLVADIAMLLGGFLLGFGFIAKHFLGSSPEALAKGEDLRGKLVKYQVIVGWILIAAAIIALLRLLI